MNFAGQSYKICPTELTIQHDLLGTGRNAAKHLVSHISLGFQATWFRAWPGEVKNLLQFRPTNYFYSKFIFHVWCVLT